MNRRFMKYIVLAAGLLASAAFYVVSGDVSAAPVWQGTEQEEVIRLHKEESSAEDLPAAASPAVVQGFTERQKEEIRALCLDILREYTSALPEGETVRIPSDPRIDLNTADREDLMTLPGIGEAKAEAIIRYREEYGGFSHIEEIMNISGIKEAGFEKLKDLIRV